MAREVMGTCTCPECGGAAEVKAQKNGMAYRWCLDCHAQYFPRSADTSARLLEKCGIKPRPEPVREQEPAPDEPKPKPKRASMGPFDFLMQGN